MCFFSSFLWNRRIHQNISIQQFWKQILFLRRNSSIIYSISLCSANVKFQSAEREKSIKKSWQQTHPNEGISISQRKKKIEKFMALYCLFTTGDGQRNEKRAFVRNDARLDALADMYWCSCTRKSFDMFRTDCGDHYVFHFGGSDGVVRRLTALTDMYYTSKLPYITSSYHFLRTSSKCNAPTRFMIIVIVSIYSFIDWVEDEQKVGWTRSS